MCCHMVSRLTEDEITPMYPRIHESGAWEGTGWLPPGKIAARVGLPSLLDIHDAVCYIDIITRCVIHYDVASHPRRPTMATTTIKDAPKEHANGSTTLTEASETNAQD